MAPTGGRGPAPSGFLAPSSRTDHVRRVIASGETQPRTSGPPTGRSLSVTLAGALCIVAGVALLAAAFRRVELAGSTGPQPRSHLAFPTGAGSAARPSPAAQPLAAATSSATPPDAPEEEPATLAEQRERLFSRMERELSISDEQMARVRGIFDESPFLGQGNPDITRHPMTRQACRERRSAAGLAPLATVARCGAANMVPVWGDGQGADTASLCIDQYEFPDLACDYPVVNVRANEADALCRALGKRLCDSHEWEGACAGKLLPPESEYQWTRPRLQATYQHNQFREKLWAYGPSRDHAVCATGSQRSPECEGGGWTLCGSNTYPAGAFPLCKSPFGVFDQHGNAAEHMSWPSQPDELRSGGEGGMTEMKGSWFIFSAMAAHEDDCRWRAPDWHPSRVRNNNSHRNYHLGFRCCKDIDG
jgi:formylglycine-generating enzyme